MSSKLPIVSQVAWSAIPIHIVVVILLMSFWYNCNPNDFFFHGGFSYFFLAFFLRATISKAERAGLKKLKKEDYENAISDFKRSYEFFKRHDWIDKFRFLTLLTLSRISYKEMALNNIAFCYGQIGKGDKSIEYYEKTLREFPDSVMAKVALRHINSVRKDKIT